MKDRTILKNILILTNNSSGLYGFRKELISALAERGRVAASTPLDGKIPELEALGCRIIPTGFDRRRMDPFQDFRLFLTYRRLLRKERPDLVITYTIKPNLYGDVLPF